MSFGTAGHWSSLDRIRAKKLYGGFYSQNDIRQVVAYARERNITVVPEIELPGHSMAPLVAYPEFVCEIADPAAMKARSYYPHPNAFCAGKERTFEFFENVLDETIDLFPSEFIHIGGDEVDKYFWGQCSDCKRRMQTEGLKSVDELQSYFIRRIEKHINRRGRRLIGWDEILEGGLAPNATVMSWRGIDGGIAAANQGHDVVMSPTSHCYFDYAYTTTPTQKVYAFDPVPSALAGDKATHILGGQANVWTEYLDTTESIEMMMLPRLTAMSEALWAQKSRKDYDDFQRRLAEWYPRFDALGYAAHVPPPTSSHGLVVFGRSAWIDFAPPGIRNWVVRYTTDGAEPTAVSPALPIGMRFDKTTRILMATFTPSGRRSEIVEANAVQSDGIAIQVQGYSLKRYEGKWTWMPKFESLTPTDEFRADTVEVTNDGKEWYGLVYSGVFHAPASGVYTFTLGSDDGSTLLVAVALAVDNDGLHGYEERDARVHLDAGSYPIEIRFFQAGGAARLNAFAEGPQLPKRKL